MDLDSTLDRHSYYRAYHRDLQRSDGGSGRQHENSFTDRLCLGQHQPGVSGAAAGHTYAFYVVATDNVGHAESKVAVTEAQTTISSNPWQNAENPGDYRPFLGALLLALDRWARDGTLPPPSMYPTIQGGTLVAWDQKSTSFPAIPGVRYPEVIQQPSLLDFGPRWRSE